MRVTFVPDDVSKTRGTLQEEENYSDFFFFCSLCFTLRAAKVLFSCMYVSNTRSMPMKFNLHGVSLELFMELCLGITVDDLHVLLDSLNKALFSLNNVCGLVTTLQRRSVGC